MLFTKTEAAHLAFTLSDCRHGIELSDCLRIHTIELSKYNFTEQAAEAGMELADPLEQWAFFLCRAAELEAAELQR